MASELESIVEQHILTGENCRFSKTAGALLEADIPFLSFKDRVDLALAFPFEFPAEYISVINREKEEVGLIRRLSDFPEEDQKLIEDTLKARYFAPKIQKILKLEESHGVSRWSCETDFGKLDFTVKDTQRSLIRAGENRIFLSDADGCRYEFEDVTKLDRRSYQKLAIYL